MTPAQSPALLEISFFVLALKPLAFCVRDGGGAETILRVCANTRKWVVVCIYLSTHLYTNTSIISYMIAEDVRQVMGPDFMTPFDCPLLCLLLILPVYQCSVVFKKRE